MDVAPPASTNRGRPISGAANGKVDSKTTLIADFAYAPDGKIAAACRDNQRGPRLIVWEAGTGKVLYETRVPVPIFQVVFASDSRHLVTANDVGVVHVYRLRDAP